MEVRRPITPDLLAAVSGESASLASRFAEAWFDTAATLTAVERVIVFDDMVVGPPCPLLLEAVQHVRAMRRAEHAGVFDDEEERWYEEHWDDEDAWYEPPTIPMRVLAEMACQQEHDRLVSQDVFSAGFWSAFDDDPGSILPVVNLSCAMTRLLVELADAVRIGRGVVVDARLPGERPGRLR